MKNRAKCKLCGNIIESFHATDLVLCSCGEISVDGGDGLRCSAKHWENFLRIDDNGKEIPIKVEEKAAAIPSEIDSKPTKVELIDMLDEMVKSYEKLPQHAMSAPITHYDLLSVLLLVSSLFKAED